MDIKAEEISKIIRDQIGSYAVDIDVAEVGSIISIGDGIARLHGVENAMAGEMLEFPHGVYGIALNLEEESVGTVLLGDYSNIRRRPVKRTGRIISVPVGDEMLGRVVNALGQPIDGKGPIATKQFSPIERLAPGRRRSSAREGAAPDRSQAIDAMVPIGRGQRELIIGDRQTGKTAVAIDAILNQKDTGVICIYNAIGRSSRPSRRSCAPSKKPTRCATPSSSPPARRTLTAPLHQPVLGVHHRRVFPRHRPSRPLVYDDLSKHAVAYREISLLLRRPPGREAYPGDVFYLHSRLLERAAKLNNSLGGGSLTALPIIETQAGDLSAYIPTNVISITDGQIFLESDLFNQGVRPAINVGNSVSRVGGSAQNQGDASGSRHVASRPRAVSRARGVRPVRQRPRQVDAGTAHPRCTSGRNSEAGSVRRCQSSVRSRSSSPARTDTWTTSRCPTSARSRRRWRRISRAAPGRLQGHRREEADRR